VTSLGAKLGGLIVALVCAYGYGRWDGDRLRAAKFEAQIALREEAARRSVENYLAEKRTRENVQRQLYDEAIQDPAADSPALSADSVRRLNAIR
jgi:hypothetical protein